MNFPRTKTLTIRATDPAKPVPRQRTWRQLDKAGKDVSVIGTEPVEVPNNRYYRRRVITGEAKLVGPSAPTPTPTPETSEKPKGVAAGRHSSPSPAGPTGGKE
jgi:hypothetical protein